MYDAGPVSCGERVGDLKPELQYLTDRERFVIDHLAQSSSGDQLHCNEVGVGLGECLENRYDIRMIQGRGHASFAEEPVASNVGHETGFQGFERDRALQAHVFGLEYLTHAAFADSLDHLEMANGLSDRNLVHRRSLSLDLGARNGN